MEPGAATPAALGDSLGEPAVPWSHVSIAPLPEGVQPLPTDSALPRKEGAHVTYLLWQRHVDLPAETTTHFTSVRLETSAAVQHQSQWRLNLDPRFHRVQLHWLRVTRGGNSSDQLRRERMRLIQRESQLDHLVIDGQWTLLVVLDDVQVGDIIEAAYSFAGSHPFRPGGCEHFFLVPPALVVGSFGLSVDFNPSSSTLGSQASADAPERQESISTAERTRWTWQGQQLQPRPEEVNQPSTFLDYVWVQVSDLDRWEPLADRLAEVWQDVAEPADPDSHRAFARPAVVDEAAVHGLIRYLQDGFRYLSVDLENGGWIPARPATVAKRRYGDCKDLVWLAVSVLRGWGVKTRPILVGSGLRESIPHLRPMALLFNHAVIEVEVGSAARWFDLTLRHQGGDYHSQFVSWFGFGLPVDRGATLTAQPGSRPRGVYAIRESIDLDTRRGEDSIVEIRIWAEGWNADHVRHARASQGEEEYAKERLAHVRRRYGKAERLGTMQWRDERARNTCEMVETFAIRDAVYPDEGGNRMLFDVPSNALLQTFQLPEEKPRRAPWDLPAPFELRHELRVHNRTLGTGTTRRRRWKCAEFAAGFEEIRESGMWRNISRLAVTADQVAVDQVANFRLVLERFLVATTWRLYLPAKIARPTNITNPAVLPPVTDGEAAYVPAAQLEHFEDATSAPPETNTPPILPPKKTWWGGNSEPSWWLAAPMLLMLVSFVGRNLSTSGDSRPDYSFIDSRTTTNTPTEQFSLREPDTPEEELVPGPAVQGPIYHSPGEVEKIPVFALRTPPRFPLKLRAIGLEGSAQVDFVINDQGVPTQITVVQESNPAFGRAASVAISKWRFQPAVKDGHPVNFMMRQPFTFTLHEEPKADISFEQRRIDAGIPDAARTPPPYSGQKP